MIISNTKLVTSNFRTLVSILFVAMAGILLTTLSAQAADTITSASYLDTDNDGTVDTVRWVFDENVTGCTYDAGDWTVDVPTTDLILAVTGLTCTGVDANLDISVLANSFVTGSATDPIFSYTNNLNNLTLTSGNALSHASVTIADAAKPVVGIISGGSGMGDVHNQDFFAINYTEDVRVYTDGAGGGELLNNTSTASTASLGAMTVARTVAGLGSWAVLNGGDITTSSATGNLVKHLYGSTVEVHFNDNSAAYYNGGTTKPSNAVFTPVENANYVSDVAGNPVNSAYVYMPTVSGTQWHVTAPTIINTYSCDTNADAKIDAMETLFSESMLDDSVVAGNFEADNDSTNNTVGEEIPSSFTTALGNCYSATATSVNDNRLIFNLTTGIAGTQAAYLHHVTLGARDVYGNRLALGSALGTEIDYAAPAPLASVITDADGDGQMDAITTTYSEVLNAVVDGTADWAISSATNFFDLIEGTMECNSGAADPDNCIYSFTTSTVKTDVGDLTLTYTAGASLVDGYSNYSPTYAFTSASTVPIADAAAPVVAGAYPASGISNANILSNLILVFSEPMNTTFLEGGEYAISPDPGTFGAAVWSDSNTRVTLNPDSSLACDTTYTVTTAEAAIDASAGTPTGLVTTGPSTGDWSFTTSCPTSGTTGGSSTPTTWSISLNSPNGGETFTAGDQVAINWTVGGTGSSYFANLYYSVDGGVSYEPIAVNVLGSNYNWTIPAGLNSTNVVIMVRTTDLVDVLAEDVSNSAFTISAPAVVTPDPTVVTAPSTGTTGKSPVTGLMEEISVVSAGDYIKSPSYSTVYYVGTDMKRHPFVDSQTYFTWQSSFSVVKVVTDATLSTLTLGTPMLPKYEVVLVKIQSVNKVYALEFNPADMFAPKLRWITSEAVAQGLYGNNWADYVIDVAPTVFTRFAVGADVNLVSDLSANLGGMKMRINLR